MPASKTKELARRLGLLKKRKAADNGGEVKKKRKGQLLSYVIVIDFESTCWKDKKGSQEIIEFPAVLLDLASGEVVSEFQQYLQPQENPHLSEFCTELTGITQEQVDGGIPLPTCLRLFSQWMRRLGVERGLQLMEPGQEYHEDMALCALATWTDWDLGVCLHYECRRKQIRKPSYFNQWIDLRALYKTFYDRRPSGLSGALEDLGITFTGRQHSGLDDARNTAKLCYRLVRDGCKLNITKCIQTKTQPPVIRPPATNSSASRAHSGSGGSPSELQSSEDQRRVQITISEVGTCRTRCCESDSEKQSLPCVQPAHSANAASILGHSHLGTTDPSPIQEEHPMSCKQKEAADSKTPDDAENATEVYDCDEWLNLEEELLARELDLWEAETNNWTVNEEKNVLSREVAQVEALPNSRSRSQEEQEQTKPVSCISLPGTCAGAADIETKSTSLKGHNFVSTPKFQINSVPLVSSIPSTTTPSRTQHITHVAPVTLLPGPCSKPSPGCQPSGSTSHRAKLTPLPTISKGSFAVVAFRPASPLVIPSGRVSPDINELFSPPFQLDAHQQGKTETKIPQLAGESHTPSSANSSGQFRTPSTAEWMKVKKTYQTPLSSDRGPLITLNGGKVTPPLCNCGKRTKRKTVASPGPNEGRPFYVCPRGRGSDKASGCGFFRWECSSPSTSPGSNASSFQTSPDILFSGYSDHR